MSANPTFPTNWVPTAAAIVAVALVIALFSEIVRTERTHREVSAGALNDYADIAAWQFARRADMALRDSLLPPLQAFTGDGVAERSLVQLLDAAREEAARCGCPHDTRPSTVFRLDGSGMDLETVDGNGFEPDRLQHHLMRLIRAFEAGETRGHGLDVIDLADSPMAIGYILNLDGRPGATGFLAGGGRLGEILGETFSGHELLPPTLLEDADQSEILSIRVDTGEQTLFRNGAVDGPYRGRTAMAQANGLFPSLEVEAALAPEASTLLLVGGELRSAMPVLILLLALAVVLGLIASRQVWLQRRLASMRTDTIARISHELRTPLAQIRLFTDTLRLDRAGNDQERHRALSVIDREVRRLDHLVNNVLRFGAHDHEREPLEPERLDLHEFLARITAEFEPLAAHRGVALHTDIEPGLVAHADAEAMRRVVFNLLDNAAKYGPEGGTIRLSAGGIDHGRARIRVDDEGPGIPVAERERIWDMYGHSSNGTAGGSGIGLALVRHYAEEHGGCVRVETAPGGGARFVVELPLAEGSS